MTRYILVLCLFLPFTALAGPRADAAEELVSTADEERSKSREVEHKNLVGEVKALRTEIAGYVAALEDIKAAHGILVRGCVDNPHVVNTLVASWNEEIDAIVVETSSLKTQSIGIETRAASFRPPPAETLGEMVARRGVPLGGGYTGLATLQRNELDSGRVPCSKRPEMLHDYGPSLTTLRSLDERLTAIEKILAVPAS